MKKKKKRKKEKNPRSIYYIQIGNVGGDPARASHYAADRRLCRVLDRAKLLMAADTPTTCHRRRRRRREPLRTGSLRFLQFVRFRLPGRDASTRGPGDRTIAQPIDRLFKRSVFQWEHGKTSLKYKINCVLSSSYRQYT